jgi:two-component system phosphate regulon response regulator PhoB
MTQLNLLVVEDEDAIREMLVMVLEQSGINVIDVATAEAAQLSLADNAKPDLILLDWMLPGISGVELARRLKQDDLFKELPIILLTARGEEEDKVRGLEIGADDYNQTVFS